MIESLFSTAWGDVSLLEIAFTAVGIFGLLVTARQIHRFGNIIWYMFKAGRNGSRRKITQFLAMVAGVMGFLFFLCVFGGVLAMQRPQINAPSGSAAITSLLVLLMEILCLSLVLFLEHVWYAVIGGVRALELAEDASLVTRRSPPGGA